MCLRYNEEVMIQLFDQTFWKFFFGFVGIIMISFSVLALAGVYRNLFVPEYSAAPQDVYTAAAVQGTQQR